MRLCSERLFPVCSPRIVSRLNRISAASDLLSFPLLRLEDQKTWARWFEAAGVSDPVPRGPVLNRASMLIDATVDGQGVHPLPQKPLPHAVRGLVQELAEFQYLGADAGWRGNRADGIRAMAANPMVPTLAASCPSNCQIWRVNAATEVLPLVPVTAAITSGWRG